ncbi:bifunctional methylenetetrahydrofolate dehydrogenase/methenyltetrahydrofolate cyclohydrolase FolD [Pseudomonas sp. DR48]|uniref:bifunctional methylenetetrahydrofolate dehydrogenase/methenyltetrahydrofolate cyclohydrolase FolD n=1 Tax=Pseudomonas sp. DR48 TaxID=2871095 RepID=UPI001C992E97|nr:bifunctional methylenetetrahydrofolate dehydrogenase/methenyltetrahydrofolate cyclohydrolase FolD [Pseudomonas sp. DR48]QZP30437.1 bifunctional methylenetetrahydrofolate dehydrogenase/methenyltetrahydrofolate cyclohydrolase FolD [Pseudomonas sp. DR48]
MTKSDLIIDGKAFAARLLETVSVEAFEFRDQHGHAPGLAVILVGQDAASQVYVSTKMKKAEEAGIKSYPYFLESTSSEEEILSLICKLNSDPLVHGILVQLPLPPEIDERLITTAIDPAKDVDGFHPVNVGMLSQGHPKLVPCTPLGCLLLLKDRLGDLAGKKAVIVGRSNIVGKPMASLLLNENCTVTIVHSRSRNLRYECSKADILVVAVGRPRFISSYYIKPGAVVIDVGINRIDDDSGKQLVGDVDYASALSVAGAITPVPGGVGPMTVACLMKNTLIAAKSLAAAIDN